MAEAKYHITDKHEVMAHYGKTVLGYEEFIVIPEFPDDLERGSMFAEALNYDGESYDFMCEVLYIPSTHPNFEDIRILCFEVFKHYTEWFHIRAWTKENEL